MTYLVVFIHYLNEVTLVKMRCNNYFEEYILEQIDSPLVLALDESDRLFAHQDVSDDFFGLLRFWHEQAKVSPVWEKLKLVVVHSTEPYLGITNINQSPFYNVGFEAKLTEFTTEDVVWLAKRHGLSITTEEIEQLIDLVGGHPFLIRRALYELVENQMEINAFIEIAPTNEGPYGDHLRRNLLNLSTTPELARAMVNISKEKHCKEAFVVYRLQAAGLIIGEFPDVRPRCELYTQYFLSRL